MPTKKLERRTPESLRLRAFASFGKATLAYDRKDPVRFERYYRQGVRLMREAAKLRREGTEVPKRAGP